MAFTDGSDNVIERYRYDVFGVPAFFDSTGGPLSSSSYDNRFLFTGREYIQTHGANRSESPR